MSTISDIMSVATGADNTPDILAKAVDSVSAVAAALQDATDLLSTKAQQLANHERLLGTATDPGHVKLGMGFEQLEDGTVNINGTAEFTAEMTALASKKADKATTVAATIGTSWTGSTAPYTQDISVAGVTPTSIVDVTLSSAATQAQVEAYQALNWTDGGQAANSITLKAWGDKNTVNIPVTVVVRG